MSNDSTPGSSLGVHRRPPACREASRRGSQASGALVTGTTGRGSQRDHFVWLLWHHQAIQATLCSQRRTIKGKSPACTGHALVMDHAIISNAKVFHVVLFPHISFSAPCNHPPASTIHPQPSTLPATVPYPSPSNPPDRRLWMSLGAWAGTKGLCYLKINDSSLR